MCVRRLQEGIGGNRAILLQGQRPLVPGLQEAVVAVDKRVFSVEDGRQLNGRPPGMQKRAIGLVGAHAARKLLGGLVELRPGHVIGGVGDACFVEYILVVIDDPEVGAERQGVDLAIDGQFLDQAAKGGRVRSSDP